MSVQSRGRPARLDHARTVDTALELLDARGLDALTMRRLAEAMDVQAGALYRYFATKQDLLTAMAERMLDGAVPALDGHWSQNIAGLGRAMRAALLAHRDGARVYAGTHSTGPNTLGFAETVTGVLREAGFDDQDAARALMALTGFTVGHTLEEQAALQPEEWEAEVERLRRAVASGRFVHLAAILPTFTGSDFAAHFEYGLRLLIRGLGEQPRSRTARPGEA